ncbi:BLUF domain-containing protein [Hyphomonas sp.]|uniref:BLUF domain-containing protein n=1 Tax=Hyphomonas sp. TaxID=87 RepID=UPI0025C48003|nr:BLUF domain-containing protein [Hyphomonas sp.]
MSNDLFRLIYVSTARPGLSEEDMSNVLNASQSNNEERYITGYLAHNRDSFMQLIEGPRAEVEDVYDRIVKDPRHSGIVRILAEKAEARAFPRWSMNYFRVDKNGHNGTMLVRRGDPVDSLMTAEAPRDLIYTFSKFIRQS